MRIGGALIAAAVLVLLAGLAFVHAQVSPTPFSRQAVTLRVTVGDAPPGRVTVSNGGTVRLEQNGGRKLTLVPTISGDRVTVRLLEVDADGVTGSDRELAELDLTTPGLPVDLGVPDLPVQIELAEVKSTAVEDVEQLSPARPCSECCVTCDGIKFCACYVEMWCGSCCCPQGGCDCGSVQLSGALASCPTKRQ